MISVVLVGTGNVAQNLFQAFDNAANVIIKQVIGRSKNNLAFAQDKAPVQIGFHTITLADVYILAVSDDAIAAVANNFNKVQGLVVHTSGGTSINVLKSCNRIGVFYPLQTFTKGKLVSFDTIPICIEAAHEKDTQLLQALGNSLSTVVRTIQTEQRRTLHVAAVFVNNFTNYMYTIGEEICIEHAIDFKLLHPLIKETAAKLNQLTPKEAQTGPAKRGDQKTLHNHLQILKDKHQREVYTLLSNAIKNKHGEEL